MHSYEELMEFHTEARVIKEHFWHVHNEPDPAPMLVVRWRDMQPQSIDFGKVGAVTEKVHEFAREQNQGHWLTKVEMSTPFVLFTCLAAIGDGVPLPGIEQMPEPGTPLESIWLAVEGYSIEGEDWDEIEKVHAKRGDMERDFKTNPASKVVERLTTYIVETSALGTAEWARITSAFHKDDGGKIIWHDPIVNTSEDTVLGPGEDEGGMDRLLDIMCPHVTREKLA